eukprot:scaffold23183_cov73-Isochrysis_galbana.AAC.1
MLAHRASVIPSAVARSNAASVPCLLETNDGSRGRLGEKGRGRPPPPPVLLGVRRMGSWPAATGRKTKLSVDRRRAMAGGGG